MATSQELVLEALGIAASILYLLVAFVLSRRPVRGPARTAHRGFVLWWAGLAFLGLATAYFAFVRPIGSFGLVGGRIALYGLVTLILVMLSGLAYYLLYLYTGKQKVVIGVGLFYGALMALFVAITEVQRPVIEAGEWAYAEPLAAGNPWSALLGLGIVLPPLLAAAAYMALYGRANDPTVKYRIVLVSAAFVLWFGYSAISTVARTVLAVQELPFGAQVLSQFLGILAGLMVLLAYVPPRSLRRRGLHSIFDEIAQARALEPDHRPRAACVAPTPQS